MNSRKLFSAVLLSFVVAATGAHAQQDQINIYSPNADPKNPIKIQAQADASPAGIPQSSLQVDEPMSDADAQAVFEIMRIVEESNAVEEIQADDPLAGMSPDQKAFIQAMQGVMPMTPEQIRMFKKRYDDSRGAARAPLQPDEERTSRSVDLTLKPGEASPVIRMQAGKVATLTFSDRNGNAWPILSVTTGDANAFEANTAGETGVSNILVINPRNDYAVSNMVVTLVDNPVPVIMTLDARDQRVVDYRTDIRIDGVGPNSNYAITDSYSLPSTGDATMISFLDGLPPRGAEQRATSSSHVEAWDYDGKLYVRTTGKLMSPAYVAKSSNVSGVSVYVLHEAPVVLISRNGVMDAITIRGN